MYPISSNDLNKETDEAVYFFTPAFAPLDNFSAHRITLWGNDFTTAEHAFQWKKFFDTDPDIAAMIRESASAHLAKEIAYRHKPQQPSDWHDRKVAIMEEILQAKAEQHADVREALLKSGQRQIIENSPVDGFWGIGADKKGKNVIGLIWMKIRDELES